MCVRRSASDEAVPNAPAMLRREQEPEVGQSFGCVVEHVEDRQPVGDSQPDELVPPFQRVREPLGGLVVPGALEQAGELEHVLLRHLESRELDHPIQSLRTAGRPSRASFASAIDEDERGRGTVVSAELPTPAPENVYDFRAEAPARTRRGGERTGDG